MEERQAVTTLVESQVAELLRDPEPGPAELLFAGWVLLNLAAVLYWARWLRW